MPAPFSDPRLSVDRPEAPAFLDEALARIDARTRAAHVTFARARDFASGLDALRGRGHCDGVRVVVNHVGLLLEVTYPASVASMTPSGLSRATTAALRSALADTLAQMTARARETWGDDPLADQIVAEVTQRFAVVAS